MSNVEYEARWFGDTSDLEPKIQGNFTGQTNSEFLFQRATVNNKNGYEFHKNVSRRPLPLGLCTEDGDKKLRQIQG